MKKIIAVVLCFVLALSVVACSNVTETISDDMKEELEKKLDDFEGIVYITKNATPVYSQANGKDENGNELTVESPMYIGSISKQFCATAIMMLKEQGKLSVDDKLDMYFPEYELGKDITIKNLLTMRSGIPEMLAGSQGHSADKTESENVAIIKEWAFEQPLNFEPDSQFEYSNTNYFLLGNIVELVSGQHYNDFIRENIFEVLEMEHSGFVNEVKNNEFFSSGLTYETFTVDDDAEGLTKGAGDVISTAPDMDKWMTGLVSGKIISDESYREMTADYSEDMGSQYGYGLMGMYKKGKGHTGGIGAYVSLDYFNEEYGYNIFVSTTKSQDKVSGIPTVLMDILVSE